MIKQPILVFGAALKADGLPHRVLIERVNAAVNYGETCVSPLYIVTGGNPKKGITEADVMRQLLMQKGVLDNQIICEDQAVNTSQSVLLCCELLQKLRFSKQQTIVVVSNAYHLSRCCWLMYISGWRTRRVAALGNASRNFCKCWVWRLREIPAIVWDSFRILCS